MYFIFQRSALRIAVTEYGERVPKHVAVLESITLFITDSATAVAYFTFPSFSHRTLSTILLVVTLKAVFAAILLRNKVLNAMVS